MQPPKKEKGPAPRPPSIVSAPSTPEREKGPAPPPPTINLITATPPTPQSPPVTTDKPTEESTPTPTKTPKETPPKEAKTSPKIKKEENVKSPAPKPPKLTPQIKETTKTQPNHSNIAVKSDKISETKVPDEHVGDHTNGTRISDVVGDSATSVSIKEAKTATPSANDANGDDASDVATDTERFPRNRRYSHADAQQSRDSGQRLVEQVCRDAEKAVIDRLIR